jgi:hypothetical protein
VRPRSHTQDVVEATVDNFAKYAFGGRSRAWLERPIDLTTSGFDLVSGIVKFLGGEGRPVANLAAVAIELTGGDHAQGVGTLIVDINGRTRSARISWSRLRVTGASGEEVYLGAPTAMRRLVCMLARDVTMLALGCS